MADTLKRIHQNMNDEDRKKARAYALAEAGKSRTEGQTHREFAKENKQFQDACEAAGVKPTRRQAQKYRCGTGRAYAIRLQP